MKNKKTLSILSLVLALLSLLVTFLPIVSLDMVKIVLGLSLLMAIVSIVFGFIGKKNAKVFGIIGIFIGFLSCFIVITSFIGIIIIGQFNNCADKGNGKAVCEFKGREVDVSIDYLNENQMK